MTSSTSQSVSNTSMSRNNNNNNINDNDDNDDLFIPVNAISSVFVAADDNNDNDDDMRSVNSASDDIEMHAMTTERKPNSRRHRHRHHRHQPHSEPIDSNATMSSTTVPTKPRGRPDYRQFTFWQLRASLAEVLAEHPMMVSERELGFTEYWNNEADEMLPACAYLALGFFCFVPWLVGCFFIRSRSPTARIAGILSAVLAFMLFAVLCVVLFNQFV
jgi:hypothetical protein